jgi:hypothetical protein
MSDNIFNESQRNRSDGRNVGVPSVVGKGARYLEFTYGIKKKTNILGICYSTKPSQLFQQYIPERINLNLTILT